MINQIKLNGENCVIKERRKPSDKPKYYIWNTDKSCYVSSLYNTPEDDKKWLEYFGQLYLLDTKKGIISKTTICMN